MKKIISALKGTALIALISLSQANAQDIAYGTNKLSGLNNLPATVTTSSFTAANVNKRAIKDFARTFNSKVVPDWGHTTSGGYTASFIADEIHNIVYYNKKGNWVASIKNYGEIKMSRDIRSIVKPVYYDYTIKGVSEVTVPEGTAYLVYLQQNATSFKTVRICNGEMDEMEWIKDNKVMKP